MMKKGTKDYDNVRKGGVRSVPPGGEALRLKFVTDPLYGEHLRGVAHPERPERVEAVAARLRAQGLLVQNLAARDATDAEIERVHARSYLELVKRETDGLKEARYLSTGDAVVDATSYRVARRAAGGAIVAAEASVAGNEAGLRPGASARAPCRAGSRHGFLPVQQRRDRRAGVSSEISRRASARLDRRLRLSSRQRYGGRRRRGTLVLLHSCLSRVSRYGHSQLPARGRFRRQRALAGRRRFDRSLRCGLGRVVAQRRASGPAGSAPRQCRFRLRRRRQRRRSRCRGRRGGAARGVQYGASPRNIAAGRLLTFLREDTASMRLRTRSPRSRGFTTRL